MIGICMTGILAHCIFAIDATFRHFRQPNPKSDFQGSGIIIIWLLLIPPLIAVASLLFPSDLQRLLMVGLLMFGLIGSLCLFLIGMPVALLGRSDLWYWQSIGAFFTGWLAQFFTFVFYMSMMLSD